MRLSRLPQVDYVVSKQSWVGRLLQRPNFELTQLMFFMNRLKQPGGQAFLSSDPAPLGANLLNWTAAPGSFKALGQLGARPVTPTTGIWLRALNRFSVKYRFFFTIWRFLPLNHWTLLKDRFLKKMLLKMIKPVAFFSQNYRLK